MWIPVEILRRLYHHFFTTGIIVVSNHHSQIHEELEYLNIYAYQIDCSFVSKELARKQYAWSHAYYILTDEGIDYLRKYFELPEESIPEVMILREAKILSSSRGYPSRRDGPTPRWQGPPPARVPSAS
jgi:small subunit ribosomal protein S10e